jgi:hypothetical protein
VKNLNAQVHVSTTTKVKNLNTKVNTSNTKVESNGKGRSGNTTKVRKASEMDPELEPPPKPPAVKIKRDDSYTARQENQLESPKTNQAS